MHGRRNTNQEGFIIPIILILVIIIGVITLTTSKNTDEASNSETQTESIAKSTVDQSTAEEYCQDVNTIGKYIDQDQVSIVKASNYNVQYENGDAYDKNGYPIKFLQWNGDSQGKTVRFSCWISGPKNEIVLHWLSKDGEDLFGSAEFETYDKNGTKKD